LELRSTPSRQAISLLVARSVFLFEALDPSILQKTTYRPVERSRAELNAAIAELFHVFQQGIAMSRFRSKTHENERDGLTQRLTVYYELLLGDMSHDDISHDELTFVKQSLARV
jgi:oligoendopeptidase F